MSDETKDETITEEKPMLTEAQPVGAADKGADEPPDNSSFIENGVMEIKIYLWGTRAYASSIGALELAKDVVKAHFSQIAMRNAMSKPKLIKPSIH